METESNFGDYVGEFRKKTITIAIAFAIILITSMAFSKKLVELFLNTNTPKNVSLVTLNPYENILLFMHFAFIIALTLVIPFLLYQLISFIKPGLTQKERTLTLIIPILGLFLFIIGAYLGFIMNKLMIIPFLSNLTLSLGIANNWSIYQFVKFVIYLMVVMGLIFQMPIISSILIRFNIIKTEHLKKYRKHVIITLIVIAALITPPDIFSLIVMITPLILLYELTIYISKFIKKR